MYDVMLEHPLRHYEHEIEEYEKAPVVKGRILFYGSSGFTNWKRSEGCWHDLEEDILRKDGSPAAVNHGFGGGTAEELLFWYDRLVRPWAPRALVVRVHPNDRRQGYSPAEIAFLCFRVFAWARADFPGIRLYACDVTPTKRNIGDVPWLNHVKQFNELLRDYCARHEDTTYISQVDFPGFYADPADAGDYFKVRQDIFRPDGVHFTHEGYRIYRDLFTRALDDIL